MKSSFDLSSYDHILKRNWIGLSIIGRKGNIFRLRINCIALPKNLWHKLSSYWEIKPMIGNDLLPLLEINIHPTGSSFHQERNCNNIFSLGKSDVGNGIIRDSSVVNFLVFLDFTTSDNVGAHFIIFFY